MIFLNGAVFCGHKNVRIYVCQEYDGKDLLQHDTLNVSFSSMFA